MSITSKYIIGNEMKEFIVLNRDSVEKFDLGVSYILISITDPYDTEPNLQLSKTRVDVLKMRFHDWDIRAKTNFDTKYPEDAKKMVFFNEDNAKEIISFIKKHKDVEVIVVNCAAGISRSAGVAAALSKCINGEDEYFFKHYLPNSLVYSTLMKEWNK